MQPDNPPSPEEWKMIADHLRLVFEKKTPVRLVSDPLRESRLQSIANEMVSREIPQCGISQSIQYGSNQPNIC